MGHRGVGYPHKGGAVQVFPEVSPDSLLSTPPSLSWALLPLESLAGFLLSVSNTSRVARLRIPFPQTGTWFLTLRSLCGLGPR